MCMVMAVIMSHSKNLLFSTNNSYIYDHILIYKLKNFSKSIKFKHPELYNKFNESAFIWVSHSPYSSINITSPMEKLSNIFWKGINNLNFYFYYFKINNNNNSQEISFNFEYNGGCYENCPEGSYEEGGKKFCKCMTNTTCEKCSASAIEKKLC